MKIFRGKKVGVSREEKSLPYYKFFERDMAAIPAEKIALIDKPSEIPAVTFDEKNLYLAGNDDDYCKVGYGNFDDGTGFVANETYMPNVKGEMLSWWFAAQIYAIKFGTRKTIILRAQITSNMFATKKFPSVKRRGELLITKDAP